jgi:hypothetical protein
MCTETKTAKKVRGRIGGLAGHPRTEEEGETEGEERPRLLCSRDRLNTLACSRPVTEEIMRKTALLFIVAGVAQSPTFYKDVAPVLEQHCQTCHRRARLRPCRS